MPASELNHPNGGPIQYVFAIQKRHNCVGVEYLQQGFPIDHMNNKQTNKTRVCMFVLGIIIMW